MPASDFRTYRHVTMDMQTWKWLKKEVTRRDARGVGTVIDQVVNEYKELKKTNATR